MGFSRKMTEEREREIENGKTNEASFVLFFRSLQSPNLLEGHGCWCFRFCHFDHLRQWTCSMRTRRDLWCVVHGSWIYINRLVRAQRKSKETARSIGTEKCVHFSNEEEEKKNRERRVTRNTTPCNNLFFPLTTCLPSLSLWCMSAFVNDKKNEEKQKKEKMMIVFVDVLFLLSKWTARARVADENAEDMGY